MAQEYDEKFEEITGLLNKAVGGVGELRLEVGELRLEVRDLRSEVRDNTSNLKSLAEQVSVLSGQFNDVGMMAIKDSGRIDVLEKRMTDLESGIH